MFNKLLLVWSSFWYLCVVKYKRRGCVEAYRVILPKKKVERPFNWEKYKPIDMTPVPSRKGNTKEFKLKIQELKRKSI